MVYYCDCHAKCGGTLKQVSKRTYERHLEHRISSNFLAGLDLPDPNCMVAERNSPPAVLDRDREDDRATDGREHEIEVNGDGDQLVCYMLLQIYPI
jgi:hypothetical protein